MLQQTKVKKLLEDAPRMLVVDTIRSYFTELRKLPEEEIKEETFAVEKLTEEIISRVKKKMQPSLRRTVNATGVILHTGLGRACLSETAKEAIQAVSDNFCNLEIETLSGKRSSRDMHLAELLPLLTGAEAGFVVNNNAGAVLLALNTFAEGKEVIVSRGQLVEIGGSFRLPEIMKKSGAKLIEVGTTNKTYLEDYTNAITENTTILLHVHTSNFRILGFTEEVSLEELVKLGKEKNIIVMDDLGSGSLIDLTKYGFAYEPTVQESIKAGMDIVTFSGDKLLGGPQAGIIVGKKELLAKMKRNPLTRALRIDKLCLAGLEATLKLYLDEKKTVEKIPVYQIMFKPISEIDKMTKNLARELEKSKIGKIGIKDSFSQVGGGSLPTENIPTKLVSIKPEKLKVDELAKKLRLNNPPIFARVSEDELLLDMRTLKEEDVNIIVDAFQ
jgi:L-seryl-tRNA(Ser) seleniumtransferase